MYNVPISQFRNSITHASPAAWVYCEKGYRRGGYPVWQCKNTNFKMVLNVFAQLPYIDRWRVNSIKCLKGVVNRFHEPFQPLHSSERLETVPYDTHGHIVSKNSTKPSKKLTWFYFDFADSNGRVWYQGSMAVYVVSHSAERGENMKWLPIYFSNSSPPYTRIPETWNQNYQEANIPTLNNFDCSPLQETNVPQDYLQNEEENYPSSSNLPIPENSREDAYDPYDPYSRIIETINQDLDDIPLEHRRELNEFKNRLFSLRNEYLRERALSSNDTNISFSSNSMGTSSNKVISRSRAASKLTTSSSSSSPSKPKESRQHNDDDNTLSSQMNNLSLNSTSTSSNQNVPDLDLLVEKSTNENNRTFTWVPSNSRVPVQSRIRLTLQVRNDPSDIAKNSDVMCRLFVKTKDDDPDPVKHSSENFLWRAQEHQPQDKSKLIPMTDLTSSKRSVEIVVDKKDTTYNVTLEWKCSNASSFHATKSSFIVK